MGMIRRADLEQVVRQGEVMNLDDLRSRGEMLAAEARRCAEQIITEAHAERDRLIAGAREEGYAAGHAEGLQAGRAEGLESGSQEARQSEAEAIAAVREAIEGVCATFEEARERMLRDARTDLVRLAVEIASRVTRRAIDLDPKAVVTQLESVLSAVARPTSLVIRVNTDDLDAAERAMPGLRARYEQCRHADLVADTTLARGSAVATTEGGGRIDASIDAQLERIVAELLPDDALLADRADDEPGARPDSRNDAA